MSWRDDVSVPAAKRQRCFAERDTVWEPESHAMLCKDQSPLRGHRHQMVACPVCLEDIPRANAVRLDGCRHAFCRDCLATHFKHGMRARTLPLRCPLPRCITVVAPSVIKNVMTGDDAHIVDQLALASLIPEHLQFYCPYPDCAALMEVEAEEQLPGCPSQCPACRRAVCSACRSAWHEGMACTRHQLLRHPSQPPPQLPISRQVSLASAFGRAVTVYAPGQSAPWGASALGTGAASSGQNWQASQFGGGRGAQHGHGQQQQQQWQGSAFGGGHKQAVCDRGMPLQQARPSFFQQGWEGSAYGSGRQTGCEQPSGQQLGTWPVF